MQNDLFQKGKKYIYRDHPGWARFGGIIRPDKGSIKAVFVGDTHDLVVRHPDGSVKLNEHGRLDVLPELAFIPATGVWSTADGSGAYVFGQLGIGSAAGCLVGVTGETPMIWQADGSLPQCESRSLQTWIGELPTTCKLPGEQ